MSDIWKGSCDRDVGFTLRVGGRRSPIDDRRNWDAYKVNGQIVRLEQEQGIKMMGFPCEFKFPVSRSKAMKQLGNSVCVDVVYHVAKKVEEYLEKNIIDQANKESQLKGTLNKGEWSEFYTFIQLLIEKKLQFGTQDGEPLDEYVIVLKVQHNKANIEYFKGSSSSKGDLNISFNSHETQYLNQNIGIKSNLGGLPTLLNASSATNFIFEVNNFNSNIDIINAIETKKSKIRNRLLEIDKLQCELKFVKCEKETHTNNLKKIDSLMPEILANLLVNYYRGKGSKISDLVKDENKICRIKDYLKAVLLGMFSTKKWDGNYSANGSILVRKKGDLLLYHVIKDAILKDYLFHNTKLDTPSSTRHRFGSLYKQDNKIFIKLNLQIRFI